MIKLMIVGALVWLVFSMLGGTVICMGQETPGVSPMVGLALSGGGARGFANIGVLKVLEEIGIPIDYIASSGTGSLIGGLYAIGYSAEEIEQMGYEVDWEYFFSGTQIEESLWSFSQKQFARHAIEKGFNWDSMPIPLKNTSEYRITNLLEFLIGPASDIEDFDSFPIPFRPVAADIVTGEEVILDRGSLASVMYASMATSGIFEPITIGRHLLAHGGLVKPLPVDVAKNMGADVVIAIDLSEPLRNQEDLKNPSAILDQINTLYILKLTQEQYKLADVIIIPDLGEYSSASFTHIREIMALGEKTARGHFDELRELGAKIKKFRSSKNAVPGRISKDLKDEDS